MIIHLLVTFFSWISWTRAATQDSVLLNGGACGNNVNAAGGHVVTQDPVDVAPPIGNDIECFLTFQGVKRRHKSRFVFEWFSLVPTDCATSNLKVYNAKTDNEAKLLETICPGDDPTGKEFISTGQFLTLKLSVAYDGVTDINANFSGFFVSYTDNWDPCKNDGDPEFLCDNGRCIYSELECDDRDSCGDGSDEREGEPTNCPPDETTTTAATTSTLPSSSTTAASTTTGASTTTSATTSTAATTTTARATTTTLAATTTTLAASSSNTTSGNSTSSVCVVDCEMDWTPVYIVLTVASVMFAIYLLYSLLSVQCFRTLMMGCLQRCCVGYMRRRRKLHEFYAEQSVNGAHNKISPAESSLNLEDLTDSSTPDHIKAG